MSLPPHVYAAVSTAVHQAINDWLASNNQGASNPIPATGHTSSAASTTHAHGQGQANVNAGTPATTPQELSRASTGCTDACNCLCHADGPYYCVTAGRNIGIFPAVDHALVRSYVDGIAGVYRHYSSRQQAAEAFARAEKQGLVKIIQPQ